jgi:hypothetical protein
MDNCCVNPNCTAGHKFLRIGDVYAIEGPGAKTECVWICSVCASSFDVSLNSQGVALVTRHTANPQPPPPAGFKLSLVARGEQGVPLQPSASMTANPANEQSGDWGKYAHRANV